MREHRIIINARKKAEKWRERDKEEMRWIENKKQDEKLKLENINNLIKCK